MRKLTARWILPIDAPPIENGQIEIDGGRIVAVGPRTGASGDDYGDAVLMPGLVSAHTHIEYTLLRGFLEDVPFFQWIRALTALKPRLTPAEWLVSARLGAAECLASGITAIGDCCDASGGSASAAVIAVAGAGLRGVAYQEVFGIDTARTVDEIIAELSAKVDANRLAAGPRIAVGISPHAPYTVRPELMRALSAWSAKRGLPVSIHVAESPAETALIERGEGPIADMFAQRGIAWDTPGVSPTRYIHGFGLLQPGTLAIHCVQQDAGDIALLAESGASVVHCPKSNAKLGSGIAPLPGWLADARLNAAIGTDSAVSNNAHDLFEEMRFGLLLQRAASRDAVSITAAQMLRMATIGGAAALGLGDEIGTLTPDKRADIIAVDLTAAHTAPATDPLSALVYSAQASDVIATIIDGETVYRRGESAAFDSLRGEASAIRARLSEPAA